MPRRTDTPYCCAKSTPMRVVAPCLNSCVSNSNACVRAFDSQHHHHFPNTISDKQPMSAVNFSADGTRWRVTPITQAKAREAHVPPLPGSGLLFTSADAD